MVVNSVNFWVFYFAVLLMYFFPCGKSAKWQNVVILMASYLFYGMVDWKMCFLLLFASILFFVIGICVEYYTKRKARMAYALTCLAVVCGVGMLIYFKYLGFFLEELSSLLVGIGLQSNSMTFNIIMPLGISFFTFKLMGYVIEIYRENIKACKDPVAFGAFVSFFPTIMSGPIDSPCKFLPQLSVYRRAEYDNAAEGFKRIIWGMFLKMGIADNLAGYTSAVLGNYAYHNTTSLLLAMFLYTFQMYSDFSGYSHMAIGVGKIMGLEVAENFNRPFFARNVAEYWRRWHISLTTWITQYVYMPLNIAFRGLGLLGVYAAITINVVLIGAWHGANWTYVLFGLYHSVLLVIVTALDKKRKTFEKEHDLKNNLYYKYSRIILTFIFVSVGLLIFQAASVSDFFGTVGAMSHGFGQPFNGIKQFVIPIMFIGVMLFKEYKDENKISIHFLHSDKYWLRILSVVGLIVMTLMCGELSGGEFIYFQF